MTLTVSPPIRIAALVGLAAALALGGSFMILGHKGSNAAAAGHHFVRHPQGVKTSAGKPNATARKPLHPSNTAAVKVSTHVKVTPAVPVARKAPKRPSAELAALAAGIPAPIASALGSHGVVVVSLYNPQSKVDGIAFAEARAGAALAGAGFVPLNVLSKAQVGGLTEQLGLLPDPGVLVYTRPSALAVKLKGFADKETVAQAAQDAAIRGS